jgi:hypothetical protein
MHAAELTDMHISLLLAEGSRAATSGMHGSHEGRPDQTSGYGRSGRDRSELCPS